MRIKGIDGVDNEIVRILLTDGRISYSEIAKTVGLTRTAVKKRIMVLEQNGVIEGYKAVVNLRNALETTDFVVDVETDAVNFETVKNFFLASEEVVTLLQTTGNCRLTAICAVCDVQAMRAFINAACKETEGINAINIHAVIDVLKGTIFSEK